MRTLEDLAKDAASDEDVCASGVVVLDLIAHVQQQAEQLATLTARVAALESAGKVQTPAKLDEAPLGVGAKVLIPGEVDEVDGSMIRVKFAAIGYDVTVWVFPEHVRSEPAAPPPPAAPAPASDDYEARARRYLADLWGVPAELEPFEGDVLKLAALLRTVDDEATAKAAEKARREERAAGEALALKFVRSEGLHEPCDAFVARLATLLRTVADEARREERAACEAVCREVAGEYEVVGAVADECANRIAARGKGDRTDG